MAKKSEAQIKFSADVQEFNQGIKKMNSEITMVRSELKLNAEQMKGSADATELLKERHKLLEKELQANQQKIEILNEKLDITKDVFGEDSVAAQKLVVQINNAKTVQEKIKQAIEQTNQQIVEQEQSQNRTETAYQQLTGKITTQEKELNELKNAYTNIVLEQGKESSTAKEIQSEIENLSKDLNENKEKLQEAEEATEQAATAYKELGDEAEESGNDARESADGYTVVKDVIADLASQAIQGAIEKFNELSVEAEAALDKMQAKVGASEQDMERYKNVIEDVYKNGFGESMEEASEAVGTVIQMTDNLNDTDLTKCTTSVMTLADVYDMDYAESLRGANSLMDQFGLTSDQAFNLIVQGAQNGLNQNGDLLDVINEYSVQFANAGLSADDMFNMIKNGADEGVWSIDKMGDAYKEFNIRMSDGTANEYLKDLGLDADEVTSKFQNGGEDAKNAMSEISQAISNCDDKTLAYQAGVGIMGTMWEDMGQDACLALLSTEGQIDKTNDAMNSVKIDAYDNIKGDISSMNAAFDELGMSVIEDAEEPLREVVQTITEEVIPGAEGVWGSLKEGISWLSEHKTAVEGILVITGSLTAGIAAYNVVTGIKTAMEAAETTSLLGLAKAQLGLNTAMLTSPVTWIVAGIVALVAGLVLAYNKSETFRNAVNALGTGLKEAFGNVVDFFGSIKSTFEESGGGLKGVAAVCVEGIKTTFSTGYDILNTLTGGKLDELKNKAKEKLDGVKSIYEENGGGIKGVIAVGLEGQKAVYTAGYNTINNLTGGKLDELKNKAKEKLDGVKSIYEENGGGIKGVIAVGLEGQKAVYTAGYNAINTLTGGKLDELKSKTKEKLDGVKNIYEENGGGIKGVIAVGMTAQKEVFETGYNAINKLTGGKLDNVVSTVKSKIESLKSKFTDGVEKIKEIFNFKLKAPDIKMPSITVTYDTSGKLAEAAKFLGLQGMPKFNIKWNAEGVILTRPTIFGFANGMLQGGGEAGPEAVLPIEKLEEYIGNQMAQFIETIPTIDYEKLGNEVAKAVEKIDTRVVFKEKELGRVVRSVL